ncbi:M23 family metallopeptidase [Cryobacterium sinapicolor]|uniref:M23 family metallopeptidase n=1 Tax=Cryobacterium sinapicolor TaxID=1259236 RepID=A0ABY2J4N5_9MICO|nr:M23 family metallopeptidase [Cryobacterium sp. TMT3-29-2]TFC98801.1 M23 family metallopeptidase [Cryobacterium sinapicolor]
MAACVSPPILIIRRAESPAWTAFTVRASKTTAPSSLSSRTEPALSARSQPQPGPVRSGRAQWTHAYRYNGRVARAVRPTADVVGGSCPLNTASLVLRLPFRGRWTAENSPANRVPSHGTHLYGTTFAIDFLAVDELGHSAKRGWRSVLATESPGVFVGFGAPILAPVSGIVVATIDGERDHEARRSQVALIPYALSQARRVREGVRSIAGNHVVIALEPTGPFVLIAHLQRGSVRVEIGSVVKVGEPIGACGNSGNSTQPHVHVQVTDSTIWPTARGRPIVFERPQVDGGNWLPRNGETFTAS